MSGIFANRLAMFQTSRGTLNSPTNKSIWFQQVPLIFTTTLPSSRLPNRASPMRKALTLQLCDRFNTVEAQLATRDHLILQFGTTHWPHPGRHLSSLPHHPRHRPPRHHKTNPHASSTRSRTTICIVV